MIIFLPLLIFLPVVTPLQQMEQKTKLSKGNWNDSPDSYVIDGYHIMCCCKELQGALNISRDSNGNAIASNGIDAGILGRLFIKYNFTHECSKQNFRTVENYGTEMGLIHYLESGVCELIVSPMVMRYDRFLHFDFLQPILQAPYAMLIPAPEVTFTNIDAIWKPFQPNVWITLFVFIVITPLALAAVNAAKNKMGPGFGYALNSYGMFVIQTIMSQSASAPSSASNKKLKIRLIIGVWCLACIWMITAYSSVLVSFVMAPHYHPLVDTVKDVALKEHVNPLVIKDLSADLSISTSTDPLMKAIAEKLNKNPSHNRCPNLSACIQQVKRGGSDVFIHSLDHIELGIQEDYDKTGKCRFAYAKEPFFSYYLGWGIRKGHPLTELVNREILRAIEFGLVDEWRKRYRPNSDQRCNHFRRSKSPSEEHDLARLSLSNLMGPFIILLVGYISSILTFGAEKLLNFLLRLNGNADPMTEPTSFPVEAGPIEHPNSPVVGQIEPTELTVDLATNLLTSMPIEFMVNLPINFPPN